MEQKRKKRVLGIVGPTASGKTALSLPVAERLGAEILCMDSMQIYRGMDIGTAKPTREERARVPHSLLDLIAPDQPFTVAQYAAAARERIESAPIPLLVGGTGLYLQALSLPMEFGAVPGDEALRARYHRLAQEQGEDALFALLRARDPVSAQRLHPHDVRRVVRALEVFELTGQPLSQQKMPGPEDSPYDFQLYALSLPRETLYQRVDARVDEMLRQGLLEEVRRVRREAPPDAQSMQGLGYKELLPVLEGRMPLEEAASLLKLRTRHFAKRQLTWFKRDERIAWLPFQADMRPYVDLICENYLKE